MLLKKLIGIILKKLNYFHVYLSNSKFKNYYECNLQSNIFFSFLFEQTLVINTFLISNTYFSKNVNFNFNGNKIW